MQKVCHHSSMTGMTLLRRGASSSVPCVLSAASKRMWELSAGWRNAGQGLARPSAAFRPVRSFQRTPNVSPFPGLDRGIRVSKNSERWTDSRSEDEMTFIFLEGGTGVGKSTLTWKLQKMGYNVYFEGFVDLCQQHPHIPPTSATMTLKWSSRLMSHLEEVKKLHEQGKIKGSVAFFDRSFLTPAVYARGLPVADFMMQVMNEVRELYSTVTVLCEAEEYAMMKQIAGRLYDASPPEKQVRQTLGEEDEEFQRTILRRYEELEEEGHVDLILDTSSSKLAIAALMHTLRLQNMFMPAAGGDAAGV